MKLMKLPSEFQKALPILKKIKEAGFEAYFVGGGVRDILLDRPIHDSSCYRFGSHDDTCHNVPTTSKK